MLLISARRLHWSAEIRRHLNLLLRDLSQMQVETLQQLREPE